MNYYTLSRKIVDDATLISIANNNWVALSSGHLLWDTFEEPLLCTFDEGFEKGEMATFYQERGVVATQEFYDDLITLGVDNIEAKRAIIRTEDSSREYDNYLLLNILGRVACADLSASDVQSLGDGMNVIDSLVMKADSIKGRMFFLVDEDTDCIVVNEDVYKVLSKKYADLHFDQVTLV